MTPTPQQNQANEELALAIQNTLTAYGWAGDGILGDYAVVGVQTRLEPDNTRMEAYFCLLSNGDMPTHHLVGLLHGQLMHQQATHYTEREH